MSTQPCFCIRDNRAQCCITCPNPTPRRGACYPCHCSKGHEACLQTQQTRAEKIRKEQ